MQCELPKSKVKKQKSPRLQSIAPRRSAGSKERRSPKLSTQNSNLSSTSTSSTEGKILSRGRLPPRSRTGCWTCRTRKVKCDEGRPSCGQCVRLGHLCDYSPRLAFRDDTPRIIERMQEVSITDNYVWDAKAAHNHSPSRAKFNLDDNRPFASLTSDEEREKKAEGENPGTFLVIVNPDSFTHLPEYSDVLQDRPSLQILRRGSLASSIAESLASSSGYEGSPTLLPPSLADIDPNVVILSKFEDGPRRAVSQSRTPGNSNSPEGTAQSPLSESFSVAPIPEYSSGSVQERQSLLFTYFTDTFWPRIAHIGSLNVVLESSFHLGRAYFEEMALNHQSLFYAIMACSSLDLARKGNCSTLEAIEYYEQTLSHLKENLPTNDSLCSDGLFLTHFLMLVYEIVHADRQGLDLWESHMMHLLNLALQRRTHLSGDRLSFLVWVLLRFDTCVALSGRGNGVFSRAVLEMNLLPEAGFQFQLDAVQFSPEDEMLQSALKLEYDTFILITRLSLLSADFRAEIAATAADPQSLLLADSEIAASRFERLNALRNELYVRWSESDVSMLVQHEATLSHHIRDIVQLSIMLYHCYDIWAVPVIWQGLTNPGLETPDLTIHSEMIFRLAEDGLTHERSWISLCAHPVTMAGLLSASGSHNELRALSILKKLEERGNSTCAGPLRRTLKKTYRVRQEDPRFRDFVRSLFYFKEFIIDEGGLQALITGL